MSTSIHHSFDIHLAKHLGGVELAILANHFIYWIDYNTRAKKNYHDGKYWMYQTLDEIANHFPYWSKHQVKRFINKLVEKNVISKGNFNKTSFDRTVWYSMHNEYSMPIWRNRQMDKMKSPDGNGEIATPIPDTKTYTETLKKKETKESQAKGAVCVPIQNLGENKNCRLTADEKEKLLEKMTAQELDYWIAEIDIAVGTAGGNQAFCRKYKTKSETHYFTILSWKRKREAEGKPIGKATGSPESNKEHAEYIKSNFAGMSQQRQVQIHVGPGQIEFVSLYGQTPTICIKYTEKGFKEQVQNSLRKKGLI